MRRPQPPRRLTRRSGPSYGMHSTIPHGNYTSQLNRILLPRRMASGAEFFQASIRLRQNCCPTYQFMLITRCLIGARRRLHPTHSMHFALVPRNPPQMMFSTRFRTSLCPSSCGSFCRHSICSLCPTSANNLTMVCRAYRTATAVAVLRYVHSRSTL